MSETGGAADAMWIALAVGALSAVSLPIGAVLGLLARPRARLTSACMAFGGGALLFALTIEIVAHSYHRVGFWPLAAGCVLGGVLFEVLNQAVNSRGGFLRKAATLMRHLTRLRRIRCEEVIDRLSRIEVLHHVPPELLARFAPHVEDMALPSGADLFEEGDPADALYLVETGELEVVHGSAEIAHVGPGGVVGEMALLSGRPRSATVRTRTAVSLWRLPQDDFEEMLAASPETARRFRELAARRTAELVALISEERANRLRGEVLGHLDEADLAPTNLEMAAAAKTHVAAHGGGVLGIWLGILLDAIPESLVIGIAVSTVGRVPWALVAGVFLANLPEAMSASVVMREHGLRAGKILWMWTSIVLVTGLGAWIGNAYLLGLDPAGLALIEGCAAGAMLTMIAETMLPEAYEQGGAIVGLSTLAGFLAALYIKFLTTVPH